MNKLPPSAASLLDQARSSDRAQQLDLDATLSKLHATLTFSGAGLVSAPSSEHGVDLAAAIGNAPPSMPPPTGVEALAGGALLSGKAFKVFLATVVLGGALGGASLLDAPTRKADSRARELPALVASRSQPASAATSGTAERISREHAASVRPQTPEGNRATARLRASRPAARLPTTGEASGSAALSAASPAAAQPATPPPAATQPATTQPAPSLAAEPSAELAAKPNPPAAAQAAESELDLIDGALAKLRAGSGAGALTLLQRHAERYPGGRFRTEREGLKVLALCQSGRVAEGRAAQARFLRDAGAAPIAAQVRAACLEKGAR